MTEWQQEYTEYKALREQLQKIHTYLSQTDENLSQLDNTIEGLMQFKELKKGSKIFSPISNGIFVEATLESNQLRMNVGGNIVVTKNADQAKQMLLKQRAEVEQMRDVAMKDEQQVHARLRQIEEKINQGEQ